MLFCALNKQNTSHNLALPIDGYSVSFCSTISELATEWNMRAGTNLFLQSSFLKALEETPPSGTSYRYGIVRHGDDVVGLEYFQLKKINLYLSLRLDAYRPSGLIDKVWHGIKSLLAKRLNSYVLVNGNMTLTGSNGFYFNDKISMAKSFELTESIAEELVCALKREKIKVRAILLKDYYSDNKPQELKEGYTEFQVQPNMILDIDSTWISFDDYLASMRSKYRVRVRRARKKADGLERRLLTLEEIHAYADDISRLYRNVADQAGFNLFILPKNYFYSLQKHLGDKMKLVAYFQNDRMVGYYTNILGNGELDAHFLGYDPACNSECQLYLNMLYDLVDDAITAKAHRLVLSRTAMEIKSSIGAEAHDMFLYLKSTNSILNKGVAKSLSYFKPDTSWVPRSPFK